MSEKDVRNWVFGEVRLIGDAAANRAHESDEFGVLKDANAHYNKFVEIEIRRLKAFRQVREDSTPGISEAQDAFDEVEGRFAAVREEIKEHRKRVYLETGSKTREVPDALRAKQEALKKQKAEVKARYEALAKQFRATIAGAEEAYARRRHEPAAATVPDLARRKIVVSLRDDLLGKKNEADEPWTEAQFRDDNPEYRRLELAAVAKVAGARTKEKINARVLAEMLVEDWPEAWKKIARLEAKKVDEQKEARTGCGLPPGCYQPAEDAVLQAIKNSRPRAPKFRSFCGGKVGVQLRQTTFGDVVSGRCSGVRLEPLKKDRWATRRAKRAIARGDEHLLPTNPERDSAFYKLSLRVGKRGKFYWLSYSVQMDRMPPEDVLVKRVYVNVRKAPGERVCRDVQWVLEGRGLAKRREFGDGVVEVRFCSRVVPGGVKVAEWRARDGSRAGEVVLPNGAPRQRRGRRHEYGLVDRLGYSAVLRSHADSHFDEVRDVLRRYVALDVVDPDLGKNRLTHWQRGSEIFRVSLRYACENWARHLFGEDHLRELWVAWRDERLAAQRDLFPRLGGATHWVADRGHRSGAERLAFWVFLWALKDRHLRRTAAKLRERAQHQRDAVFREAAIELSKSFGHMVCDGADLSKQKRRPRVEEESNSARRLRQMRQDAAPGRCREIFREVFAGHVDVEDLGGVPGTETAREQDHEALTDTYEGGGVPDAAE